MDDFYDLLGVSEDATPAEVRRAWRGKAREYHPDVNDDARAGVQFKTLRTAYEVLSDETKRAAYDRMGHERYVTERLDGLPTAGMERRDDGGGRWQKRAATGGTAGRSQSNESAASSSNGTSNRSRSTGGSANASAGRTRTGRSRAESTGRSRSTTGPSQTGTARSANRSSRTGSASAAGRADASGNAESASSTSFPSSSPSTSAAAPRSLWYAWVASLLAGVAYLGGLAVYLRANAAALSSFAAAVEASPAAALLSDAGLVAPGAFALAAVGSAPAPALVFPLAAALLAVVFVAFAVRFRHGTAGLSLYLYPLGALAPLASLALGPLVDAPAAGLTLALVVAVPVLTVTVFLADVGRALFASE